jgi:PAT family beta-lactamase induction signal transducer AmpG
MTLHPPLRWVPTLYFAMGLPFVVLNMVSAVLFKDLGISDAQIAFWTSLIMWPWTIKFLWSPFLEIFRTKKFFVVTTQLLSGILFGLAALSLHLPSSSWRISPPKRRNIGCPAVPAPSDANT